MNKDSKDLRIYAWACFYFFVFVIIVFAILNSIFTTDKEVWLNGNAWATIIIGDLSASCTLFLGFVSYWQNKQQRQDYLEKIKELEIKISELERKSK